MLMFTITMEEDVNVYYNNGRGCFRKMFTSLHIRIAKTVMCIRIKKDPDP